MGWKRKRLEALQDEDLHDVYLVGTDGVEVGCTKTALAAISPVFKSMFFTGFREQKADRCHLDFHSVVIGIVVKYCYCGDLDIFTAISEYDQIVAKAEKLLEVLEAGRYFELEELRLEAEKKIVFLVFRYPMALPACLYAVAFLNELFQRGLDDGPLWSALFQFAVENAERCFGNPRRWIPANGFLLVKVLESIGDTFIAVKCIQNWFDKCLEHRNDAETQALVDFAKKSVDLKKLAANELSLLFKERSCDLFPSWKIVEAFCHSVQGKVIQSSTSKRKKLFVSGAGMEDLNGFYYKTRNAGVIRIFHKKGRYDDHDCQFIVHYRSASKKWLLSITKTDSVVVDDDNEVDKEHIELDVYEAEHAEYFPFNGWKSLTGLDTSPIVTVFRC